VPVALPAPRHGHRLERVGGGLLSFGGFGDASAPDREMKQTWWLAPGAKEWVRRADMGAERAFFSSTVVDGSVYAIGDGLERYDAEHDRWTSILPAGSLPKSHFASATIGSTLYVLGGYYGAKADLLAVDLPAGKLRELPPPPGFAPPDHFHCLHVLGGRLHVVGGLDGETFEPKAEHWVLGPDGWKADVAPPVAVWAKFAVQAVCDGKLYLFGEFGAYCFDPAAGTWRERAKLPLQVAMPQTVVIDGALWVVGGMRVGPEPDRVPILLRYEPARDAWSVLSG
jgi:hypothetical protein